MVTATLLPKVWQTIYQRVRDGRLDEALAMHREMIPLLNLAFAETNPGPMKSVMDLIGVNAPRLLCPLVAPAADLVERMREELASRLAWQKTL